MSFIRRIVSPVREFAALAAWLVGLLLQGARGHTLAAFALSLIGTATHVTAIAIFLAFVHAQTSDGVLEVGPLSIEASTTVPSLLMWSSAVLLMALFAASAAYGSARLTLNAGRRAARQFLHRALSVLTDSHRAHNELLSNEDGRALARRAFVSDSFILIRSSVAGVGLFAPSLLFLIATGALLWLDPLLTAGIAVPLAAFAVPFWRLNRDLINAARGYRNLTPIRSGRLRGLFDYVSQTHVPELEPPEILDDVLADPATIGAEHALGHIMLRGQKVHFLRTVFLGLVLCGMLFATGAILSSEKRSWTALATYAISLQYAMATVASVATSVTTIARFVPFLERMRALTTTRPSLPPGGAPVSIVFRAPEPRLPGSESERTLRAGDTLWCASALPLTAFGMPAFLERLTGRGEEAAQLAVRSFFCGHEDPGTILETLGISDGLLADRQVFVLDWASLAALDAERLASVLALLEDQVTILVTKQLPRTPPVEIEAVAILGEKRLIGLGDAAWWSKVDQNHELVREFCRARAAVREIAVEADDDDLIE